MKRNYSAADLAAANWIVRLEDVERPTTAREQIEFFEWLKRSPAHVKAFLQIADVSRAFDGFDAERRIDLEQFLAAGRSVVTPIGVASKPQSDISPAAKQTLTLPWRALAAGLGILAITAALILTLMPMNEVDYETDIGEQRIVKLDDRSVVQLNTRSQVDVQFTSTERHVTLKQGEALFTIERDPHRPFYVHTSSATVQAIGTQFNVRENAGTTTVSVVEGSVQVTSGKAAIKSGEVLKAGEQARVAAGAVTRNTHPHMPNALAWQERRLVFEETPLGEVIAEFNRYNAVQLSVEGPLATQKHLTAIFNADRPESLIHYLEQEGDVSVTLRNGSYTIEAK